MSLMVAPNQLKDSELDYTINYNLLKKLIKLLAKLTKYHVKNILYLVFQSNS